VREKKSPVSKRKGKKEEEEEALLGFNTHASFDCATTFARARTHGQQPAINQSKKKGVPEEEQEEDDVVVVVGDGEWLCVCVSLSLSH
jgi:hypothetical protein